jgi:hypothetical protein
VRQIGLRTGFSSGFDEPANGLKIVHRRKRQSEINRGEQPEDLPECSSDGLYCLPRRATIRTPERRSAATKTQFVAFQKAA